MSILGKLLAVLNIFAALGFAYLAAADWTQRHNWSYAVYRMGLPLNGLPVNEDEIDADSRRRIDNISDATLQDLFKSVGGLATGTVLAEDKTQLAEVQRVHDKLKKEIEAQAGDPAKRQKLASLMMPFAATLSDRQELADRIKNEPIEKLMGADGPFEKAFGPVLKNRGAQAQDQENTRRLIAELLFGLSQDDQSRQRAAVVVGLRAFTHAVNQRAQALQQMAHQVHGGILADRSEFEKEQRRIIGELELLARTLDESKEELDRRRALVNKHNAFLQARVADIVELKKEIDAAGQATKDALAQLAQEQRRLFEVQDQVGNAMQKNQQLEQELRTLEKVN